MRFLLSLTFVAIAAATLMLGNKIVSKITLTIHSVKFVDGLIKYQILAFLAAFFLLTIQVLLFPQSTTLLRWGNLSAIAVKEKWLGINNQSTWFKNGMQLLVFISLATGVFMFLGVKYTNSLSNFKWWFIPYVLVFSLTNAFSEEIIFRFGIMAGLLNYYPKWLVMVTSAVAFGLPHFFGNPGGPIGVIMSGVLGYILCKASIETKGLGLAWVIHVVQDIIIFLAVFMMQVKS